jgi:hypothetical protein
MNHQSTCLAASPWSSCTYNILTTTPATALHHPSLLLLLKSHDWCTAFCWIEWWPVYACCAVAWSILCLCACLVVFAHSLPVLCLAAPPLSLLLLLLMSPQHTCLGIPRAGSQTFGPSRSFCPPSPPRGGGDLPSTPRRAWSSREQPASQLESLSFIHYHTPADWLAGALTGDAPYLGAYYLQE